MLVCFASEKGGAGKTTLAALLAERATELALPVRLIDADPQGSLQALSTRAEGRLPACRVAAAPQLSELAREAQGTLTLLDLPSGLGAELEAALDVADAALVPVVPSAFDLRTLPTTLGAVRRAQDARGGRPRALIVPNKIDLREPMSQSLLATLSRLGWPVAPAWLRERSAYRQMGCAGLGALPRGTRRNASDEVVQLFEAVLEFLGIEAGASEPGWAGRSGAEKREEAA